MNGKLASLKEALETARSTVEKLLIEAVERDAEMAEVEAVLEAETKVLKKKLTDKDKELSRYVQGLASAEDRMLELEDELRKLEDERECDAESTARRKALDDLEAYEEEETGESKGRQHSHEVREAVMMFLALGIAPSKVTPALAVSKVDFNGRQPKLRWIQNMRKELRVVVCILAAATAADREVFPRASIRAA